MQKIREGTKEKLTKDFYGCTKDYDNTPKKKKLLCNISSFYF